MGNEKTDKECKKVVYFEDRLRNMDEKVETNGIMEREGGARKWRKRTNTKSGMKSRVRGGSRVRK